MTMSKSTFLEELANMSKDEIDRLIKLDGKEPKPIKPVRFKDKNNNNK